MLELEAWRSTDWNMPIASTSFQCQKQSTKTAGLKAKRDPPTDTFFVMHVLHAWPGNLSAEIHLGHHAPKLVRSHVGFWK